MTALDEAQLETAVENFVNCFIDQPRPGESIRELLDSEDGVDIDADGEPINLRPLEACTPVGHVYDTPFATIWFSEDKPGWMFATTHASAVTRMIEATP
jgi:hypothetical protein